MFVFHKKLKETPFGHGIRLTNLGGEGRMSVLHWQTPAGTVAPAHEHAEEQFGYVLEGSFEVTIGEKTRLLKPGDCYFIPGGVRHQFRMIDDSVAIDVFSPRRAVPEPMAQ